MLIPKTFKLQGIPNKKGPNADKYTAVFVHKGRAYSTDGKCMASVPVEFDDDDGPEARATDRLIPAEVVDASHKNASRYGRATNGAPIRVDENGRFSVRTKEGAELTFPPAPTDRPELNPAIVERVFGAAPEPGSVRVALNPSLLLKVADAIGAEVLALEIPSTLKPVRIRDVNNRAADAPTALLQPWDTDREGFEHVFGYPTPAPAKALAPSVKAWPNGNGFDVVDVVDGLEYSAEVSEGCIGPSGEPAGVAEYHVRASGTGPGSNVLGHYFLRIIAPKAQCNPLAFVRMARDFGTFAKLGREPGPNPTMRLQAPECAPV